MHNSDIVVEFVGANTTDQTEQQSEPDFMAIGIHSDFRAKAWAFAMKAKAYAMAGEVE